METSYLPNAAVDFHTAYSIQHTAHSTYMRPPAFIAFENHNTAVGVQALRSDARVLPRPPTAAAPLLSQSPRRAKIPTDSERSGYGPRGGRSGGAAAASHGRGEGRSAGDG